MCILSCCRLLGDFILHGSRYQEMLERRLHDPVYDGPPTPAQRSRDAFIVEAGRQLRESYAAAPLSPQQLMWNDLLLRALQHRGPETHLLAWMLPGNKGEGMDEYLVGKWEMLKEQMKLYEEMFVVTTSGEAVGAEPASAATEAAAPGTSGGGAGSSGGEKHWPTDLYIMLEAEWAIR